MYKKVTIFISTVLLIIAFVIIRYMTLLGNILFIVGILGNIFSIFFLDKGKEKDVDIVYTKIKNKNLLVDNIVKNLEKENEKLYYLFDEFTKVIRDFRTSIEEMTNLSKVVKQTANESSLLSQNLIDINNFIVPGGSTSLFHLVGDDVLGEGLERPSSKNLRQLPGDCRGRELKALRSAIGTGNILFQIDTPHASGHRPIGERSSRSIIIFETSIAQESVPIAGDQSCHSCQSRCVPQGMGRVVPRHVAANLKRLRTGLLIRGADDPVVVAPDGAVHLG